ncbi:MAG TPA: trigger factor [Xanthomonadales bacterium]|nr:trigger factor [Xanthomonadales bacterium]
MQVSVENTGGLERRLTVQIPAAEIQQKVESRLQELSKQVKIKGFRPGRVPLSVVRQRYGKQVRAEIANEAMQSSLQQAIRDENLRLASMPKVDQLPEDISQGDLTFSALLEVYPEVGTVDVSALTVERPQAEVGDTDVDDMLNTLREQRSQWVEVARTPVRKDQVLLEYAGHTEQGRVPESGYKKLAIGMGVSGFDGLETALQTLQAGDEAEAELEFPENFREPALAGKKARVELRVNKVSEMQSPEVDEEFIKSFGIADGSLDTLRKEIRSNLERELKQAATSLVKVQIIEKLLQLMPDLAVPEGMVRQEANSLAARVAAQAGRQPAPEEAAAFMDKASERVRAGLLMGEISRQNSIRIDQARVRNAIETIAQTYEDPNEVIQLYYGNPQLMSQVENIVLEEQVVDWVLENAKVSAKEMKFKEVISGASLAAR